MHTRSSNLSRIDLPGLLVGTFVCVAAVLIASPASSGAAPPADDGVTESAARQAGAEALRSAGDLPWYDRDDDAVRRIPVQDSNASDRNRASDWQSSWKAGAEGPRKRRGATKAGAPTRSRFSLTNVLQVVFWVLLVLLLVGLAALLVWAFLRREASSVSGEDNLEEEAEGAGRDIDRVENLPFRVSRPDADFLAEARRHYDAGDLDEAMVYLYSHVLVQLDRHQCIRLARGKTNRQYLREVRAWPALAEFTEYAMLAFEDVFFGRHTLTRDRFDHCWKGLEPFHQQLRQAEAA